ncbi:Protein air1 [Schizosaccharomyces pombe]
MTVSNQKAESDDGSDIDDAALLQKINSLPIDQSITNSVSLEKHDFQGSDDHDSSTDLSDSTLEDVEGSEWADVSRGRYFGSDPSESIVCHNCKGTGHISKDCPHVLCTTCGAIDDHISVRCPWTKKCMNCGLLGHIAARCSEPRKRGPRVCRTCHTDTHTSSTCPLIWRYYVEKEHPVRIDVSEVRKFCYNCASDEHFGDDCTLPSRSNYPESTAFCEANCPSGNDASNKEFFETRRKEFQLERREQNRNQKSSKQRPFHKPGNSLASRLGSKPKSFKRKHSPPSEENGNLSFHSSDGRKFTKTSKKNRKRKW